MLLKTGVRTIGATVAIGAIPNVSGTAAESGIKSGAITGLSKVAGVLPTAGKVVGAGLVLGSVKKLKKSTKKLTGGKSL